MSIHAPRTERLDVELRAAAISEAIPVTADTPVTAAVESTQVSTNFKQELIEQLPVFSRTKHGADRIVRKLKAANVAAAALHSNQRQHPGAAHVRRKEFPLASEVQEAEQYRTTLRDHAVTLKEATK